MEIWEEIKEEAKRDAEHLVDYVGQETHRILSRLDAKIDEAKNNEILQAIGLLSTAVKSLAAKVNDIEAKLTEDDD